MWEYDYTGMTIHEIDFVDYLKSMGEEQWELAFAFGDFVGEGEVRLIWKRSKVKLPPKIHSMETLSIVPVEKIPKDVVDCPTDNLLKLYKTCLQMVLVCVKENGIGLSAVQVGIPWRLFIVRYMADDKDKFRFFLNCGYKPLTDEKEKSLEGCISLKNAQGAFRHFQVERFKNVSVEGQELVVGSDLKLDSVKLEPAGFYSNVFQHEIEHQLGILISDPGKGVEFEIWK